MTLCACGCGRPTPIASKTVRKRWIVKGAPIRFIHGHTGAFGKRGPEHPGWRGGRVLSSEGYVRIRRGGIYVPEHVLVAESALGHSLPPGAEVHHRNQDHADNRPENLVICQDHSYHALLHARLRRYRRALQGITCRSDRCGKAVSAKCLCKYHYQRQWNIARRALSA